jgi:hypothetical protein
MTYRLLREGEKIESGDEAILDDAETWVSVPLGKGETVGETWTIGCEWNGRVFKPFRRKIIEIN